MNSTPQELHAWPSHVIKVSKKGIAVYYQIVMDKSFQSCACMARLPVALYNIALQTTLL